MSRFAAVHNTPRCREVAFFMPTLPRAGEPFRAMLAVLSNGRHPVKGHKAECSACGEEIVEKELVFVREDKDLPTMSNVFVIPTVTFKGI